MSKLGAGWLQSQVKENDCVYIFLSLPCFPSDHKKEVYLLPYDTEPSNLDKSAIRLDQILDSIKKLKAKNVFIFIEGPFAGAVEAIGADDCWFGVYNLIVDKKTESNIEKSKKLVLILSSKDNQPTTSGAFFQIMAQELSNLPHPTNLSAFFEQGLKAGKDPPSLVHVHLIWIDVDVDVLAAPIRGLDNKSNYLECVRSEDPFDHHTPNLSSGACSVFVQMRKSDHTFLSGV